MQRMMSWHNYRTGEMEYRDTPTDYSDYMPQDVPHQMLYKLYQEHEGLDPIHAFIKVMEKSAGVGRANTACTPTDGGLCENCGEPLAAVSLHEHCFPPATIGG